MERKVGSIIDLRLPGDPTHIDPDVLSERRTAYLIEEKNARIAACRALGNIVADRRRTNNGCNRSVPPPRSIPLHQNTASHPYNNGERSADQIRNESTREVPDSGRKGSAQPDLIDEYHAMASNPYFGLGQA